MPSTQRPLSVIGMELPHAEGILEVFSWQLAAGTSTMSLGLIQQKCSYAGDDILLFQLVLVEIEWLATVVCSQRNLTEVGSSVQVGLTNFACLSHLWIVHWLI